MSTPRPLPRRVAAKPAAADNPPVELDADGTAIPQPPEQDSLQSMLADLAGSSSAKVTVYRAGKNQQLAYVFQCSPDAFSLDELRDRYNGGTFRLFISVDGVLRRNMTVNVEPKQTVGAAAAIEAPTAADSLAATMREGFALQAAAMRELAQQRQTAPASPFSGMDLPATIAAISAAITALRPIVAPPPAQTGSIDMLLKGIELAKELRSDSGEGGEPGMMSILRDLIKSPMLAQAVMAQAPGFSRETSRQAPPPQPQILAPVAQQAPNPQPQPAQADNADMQNQVKGYLSMLCGRAANGADPALYADLIADMLTENDIRQLLALQPNPVDYFAAAVPETANHREWFTALLNELSQIVNEGIVDPAQAVAQSGDATDAAPPQPVIGPTP